VANGRSPNTRKGEAGCGTGEVGIKSGKKIHSYMAKEKANGHGSMKKGGSKGKKGPNQGPCNYLLFMKNLYHKIHTRERDSKKGGKNWGNIVQKANHHKKATVGYKMKGKLLVVEMKTVQSVSMLKREKEEKKDQEKSKPSHKERTNNN